LINSNLFAVVVIYNRQLNQSPTYAQFEKIIESKNNNLIKKLFIFDNSTIEEIRNSNNKYIFEKDNKILQYVSLKKNVGLAKAYNYVLNLINKEYKNLPNKWLLITDQDTDINVNLIYAFKDKVRTNENNLIGSYIPRIYGKNHLISPLKVNRKFWGDSFDLPEDIPDGVLEGRYTAINSCSIFNIAALNKIQGFSEKFPIDYLDHYTYYVLWKNNYQCYCLDVNIQHDLSFESFKKVKYNRYKNFLISQMNYFVEIEKGNKLKLIKSFIHCYRGHAKRTIRNLKLNYFIKGSLVIFNNIIKVLYNKEKQK
jgi:hypothetical protein